MKLALARLTPMWMRVTYGPNRSLGEHRDLGAYAWVCNRRRCVAAGVGGYARTRDEAQRAADRHARQHFGMRIVYESGQVRDDT